VSVTSQSAYKPTYRHIVVKPRHEDFSAGVLSLADFSNHSLDLVGIGREAANLQRLGGRNTLDSLDRSLTSRATGDGPDQGRGISELSEHFD
jgi:hypothetical protein